MAKIDHLAARDGGIQCFAGLGNKVGFAKTPELLAEIFITHGLANVVSGSSNMDFGTEEGFATNAGPMDMHDEAIAIYNWEVNGVAS